MEKLNQKFWELPTQIKNGYLKPIESTPEVNEDIQLVMMITNGKVTGWVTLN